MSWSLLESLSGQIDAFLWPEEDAKQRAKRERILEAASELFVRRGYRKTSVDEVAKLAGIAKGTVYLYYRSKAELVFHAIALEKRAFLGRMVPLRDASLSPRDRLRALIAQTVAVGREMPLSTSLTQGDREIEIAYSEMDVNALADITDLQVEVLVQMLDEATGQKLSPAVLRGRSRVLIDLMLAVSTSRLIARHGSDWGTFAATLADLVVDGVVDTSAPAANAARQRGVA